MSRDKEAESWANYQHGLPVLHRIYEDVRASQHRYNPYYTLSNTPLKSVRLQLEHDRAWVAFYLLHKVEKRDATVLLSLQRNVKLPKNWEVPYTPNPTIGVHFYVMVLLRQEESYDVTGKPLKLPSKQYIVEPDGRARSLAGGRMNPEQTICGLTGYSADALEQQLHRMLRCAIALPKGNTGSMPDCDNCPNQLKCVNISLRDT